MKIVSAEEAVSVVKSGQTIFVSHACNEPVALVEALIARKDELRDVRLINGLHHPSRCRYLEPDMKEHFKLLTFLGGPPSRKALQEGRAEYIPSNISYMPRLFREGIIPVDVAMLQVSPPDRNGYMSTGISVGVALIIARVAKKVIAQINEIVPRTGGQSLIHESEISLAAKATLPLLEMPSGEIGEVEKKVAENVADLIPDRACIQLGLGAIPDMIQRFLMEKKEIGFHSGMATDGIIELIERGVVTNTHKPFDHGVSVAGGLMGTARLYRYADNNPKLEVHSVERTHNIDVLGRISNFVAINSAIEGDLRGQINAESLGVDQVSGVGGQLDFIRAAEHAPGGMAITAMTSTSPNGKHSRIIAFPKYGTTITTPRHDVQFVVTEYGHADLRGKTLKERARALLKITHPDFRDGIKEEYEKMMGSL
jgi:4-hydroxybutyrate CoA-transferase